jgi:hypothetical protein
LPLLPKIDYLVDRFLPRGVFVVLAGAPGTFKSALLCGLSVSVASGQPWAGRAVKSGGVVWLAAEGVSGLRRRVRAWCHVHGLSVGPAEDRISIIEGAPDLRNPDCIEEVVGLVSAACPDVALVIVDTLARHFGGGNEKEAVDMNLFVNGCQRLQQRLDGPTLIAVHHTGWNVDAENPRERGSSNLRGAADLVLFVDRPNRRPVCCLKPVKDPRDGPPPEPMWFERVDIAALLGDPPDAEPTFAMRPTAAPDRPAPRRRGPATSLEREEAARAILRITAAGTISRPEVLKAAAVDVPAASRSTVKRALADLIQRGELVEEAGLLRAAGKPSVNQPDLPDEVVVN